MSITKKTARKKDFLQVFTLFCKLSVIRVLLLTSVESDVFADFRKHLRSDAKERGNGVKHTVGYHADRDVHVGIKYNKKYIFSYLIVHLCEFLRAKVQLFWELWHYCLTYLSFLAK